MIKQLLPALFILSTFISAAQVRRSVVEEEASHYSQFNLQTEQQWDSLAGIIQRPLTPKERSLCTLNKKVYGWHPYWGGTSYLNYDWSLLSHLCYFSYEVNPSTGNDQSGSATPAHNFSTSAAVTAAINNGVDVTLCVTLFGSHSTFWASSAAQQTLISNLISMVQSRGAKGVNIDFEGMGTADKTPFKNFMISLCNQMHSSIPGSEVSIALYAVEWSSIFDIPALNPYVDHFIIMGYDYYYGGSTTAGPTDPLYNFATTYNYTLTKSVTYYLKQGVTPSKLLLGLPYYGREWETTLATVPSSTVSGGYTGTRTYKYVRDNPTTYSNKQWDSNSSTPYYVYQTGGANRQSFIDDAFSLGKRFDMVNQRGIGGIGIWALGYDDGYNDIWNKISDKFTTCATMACSDTIYDMGGPNRNYYDNENYTYTISPTGASSVSLTFSSFSLGAGDTLRLYNGPSATSPLIGTYTGTTSPGTVNASGNSITVRFKSDAATPGSGFMAKWNCVFDNTAPVTMIQNPPAWATQSFSSNYTDTDNSGGTGVEKSYYQVLENNGTEWRANNNNGFFNDNFDAAIHPSWTSVNGTWAISGGYLLQSDETSANTNLHTPVTQNLSNRYLYHWQAKIGGTGTNRRAGLHYFCDNPALTNRGNSYFVWFRADNQQMQIYKVVNDTFYLKTTATCSLSVNTWYDFKVFYDRITGKTDVYVDNTIIGTWTDPSPYSNGSAISLRSGNCIYTVNDLKVYRSRAASTLIKVGASATNDIRYQNSSPSLPSGRIKSIINDGAGNLSTIDSKDVNVDWTAPLSTTIRDGSSNDLDTTTNGAQLSANWTAFTDPNSGLMSYSYSIGTAAGDSNIVSWTSNGTMTSFTKTGLTLVNGTTYYVNVRGKNNAGLSTTASSDGIIYAVMPVASFSISSASICQGETVTFTNTSSNATNYQWTFEWGTPASSTDASPQVQYVAAGNWLVTLVASNGTYTDTLSATINVLPVASVYFSANDTSVNLPNSTITFTNSSVGASSYLWDFGDGSTSTQYSPVHTYTTTGSYTVTLTATTPGGCNTTVTQTDYIHVYAPIGIKEFPANTLILIPNPANERIKISGSTGGELIQVLDMTGRVCIEKQIISGSEILDISSLSEGSYMVRAGEKISLLKVVR